MTKRQLQALYILQPNLVPFVEDLETQNFRAGWNDGFSFGVLVGLAAAIVVSLGVVAFMADAKLL